MHDLSIHKYFSNRRRSVNKANKAGRLRLNFENNPPCGFLPMKTRRKNFAYQAWQEKRNEGVYHNR